MRIVGGQLRGRRLQAPPAQHRDIRPSTDRLRETIFDILMHRFGRDALEGQQVLDLFAGTGALGLEALSRGAARCHFIEQAPQACAIIRRNIVDLDVIQYAHLRRSDVTRLATRPPDLVPCGLVFVDPPYGKGLGHRAIARAHEAGWISDGGLIILEEDRRSESGSIPCSQCLMAREIGRSRILFLRYAP